MVTSKGRHVGFFKTKESALSFAEENDYSTRVFDSSMDFAKVYDTRKMVSTSGMWDDADEDEILPSHFLPFRH